MSLEWQYKVLLFEKNPHLWAKVIISGWWRCNVTTGFYRKQDLQPKYIRGRDLIKHAMSEFWPRQIYKWFENQWVPLKIEKDMRVFPVSDNGKDIVGAFEKVFSGRDAHEARPPVDIKLWCHVAEITWASRADVRTDAKKFTVTTKNWEIYSLDYVVLTTWGNAYRHTGSTWDGYAFAQALWHTVTPLWPSLNSFQTNNEYLYGCSGLSFENARLNWNSGSAQWPILLTHFGISWPLTFIASAYLAFEIIDVKNPIIIKFVPKSDMNYEKWRDFLTQSAHDQPNKQLDTILWFYFPDRFVDTLLTHNNINHAIKMWHLSKEEKKIIARLLWDGVDLTVTARRAWDEFVTAGGVPAEEINPKTMESLICPWLYFAGEIMDVDGVTWWYNLTSSWATGKLAGESIIKKSNLKA